MKRVILAAMAFTVLLGAPHVGATEKGDKTNQVSYWCDGPGVKYEPVATPYVVPAPPTGYQWTLLVLKAGSGEGENTVVQNPVVGQSYYNTTNLTNKGKYKDISHVILCKEQKEIPPTTTQPPVTTVPPTTVPPTTQPPTTLPPETVPPTTQPPVVTTVPPVTTPPVTTTPPPVTTVPPVVTVPETTAPPTTPVPETTPATTQPPAVVTTSALPDTGANLDIFWLACAIVVGGGTMILLRRRNA